jgi:hypothetical protein
MKRWIALALALTVMAWQAPAHAQGRVFSQAELDALLAPVALYPDSVLSHILVATTRPEDLRQAAAWLRANPQLSGEQAVQAAEPIPWHPSVKALLAFPDLVARMDESPRWTADLATAFIEQEPYVMDTIQALRRRAQSSGGLQSNEHYSVQDSGGSIAVYPAQPDYVYLPYYNPYVVYGAWWWHSYRPVYWHPWHPRHVHVHPHFHGAKVDWHQRHGIRHGVQHYYRHLPHAPQVTVHNHARPVRPIIQGARIDRPSAPHRARRSEHRPSQPLAVQPRVHHAQPLLEGVRRYAPTIRNPASSAGVREQRRVEPRREQRPEPRPEPRQARQHGQRRG